MNAAHLCSTLVLLSRAVVKEASIKITELRSAFAGIVRYALSAQVPRSLCSLELSFAARSEAKASSHVFAAAVVVIGQEPRKPPPPFTVLMGTSHSHV